jgi:hypothetical protein
MVKKIAFIFINLLLITAIQLFIPSIWWAFLPISLLMGVVLRIKSYPIGSFSIGFIAGLLSWIGGTLYYHASYDGSLVEKTAELFFLPFWLFILVIGVIAGLLNGLALYTGYAVFKVEEKLEL